MVIHLVYLNKAHLSWNCLAADPKDGTLPWSEEVHGTGLLGVTGIMHLPCKSGQSLLAIAIISTNLLGKIKTVMHGEGVACRT